ncbi:response regulator [Paraburkholderia adhaesiva]|uniref:response regulator n=1 Tax=Paraburkholderia adhaesiva TaxID=2883244 RepID=UPI001F34E57B|nr:response regulator transcription factor [Paraburkholderia adhaesiva]
MRHRVLIAEDQHLLRGGLCAMVSALDDFEIAGEAGDGREACHLAAKLDPDLILMDLSMPAMGGLDAIASIKQMRPAIRIIALTVHFTDDHVDAVRMAGGDGYVVKDAAFADIVDEMRRVMTRLPRVPAHASRGTLWISGVEPAEGVPDDRATACAPARAFLTQRERTVLRLVAQGHTNREIGAYLRLSSKTVEKHRASLMRKLDVTNVTGLVRAALDMGMVALPDRTRTLITFL